jgi:hypothetical protein
MRSLALRSYFMGGFECSTKLRPDGRRLDLIESTGHGRWCFEDYRALVRHGIGAARDGLRWHLIERSPGSFDWSCALPQISAARASGVQVIWDLCHYGWPDWLDIWSADFVVSFARFAKEAARIIRAESEAMPFVCPINEISYWAWAVDNLRFEPCRRGGGPELKRQLVRASIAAARAIKNDGEAAIICAEPLIHIAPASIRRAAVVQAERRRLSQFEAIDMITGKACPELGGHPGLLDLVGVNFYPDNQWSARGATIPLGHHAYRPLREMLSEVFHRYGCPITISETGAEGTARPAWLHYVSAEAAVARRSGIPIEGICIYPILDYPGWADDRCCRVGLFSSADEHGHREVDHEFAEELERQRLAHLSGPFSTSVQSWERA